ncbi:MAG: sodium-translocating pyrophosphatase [bacterium]
MILLLAPIGSILALLFAGYLATSIMKKDEGTEDMKRISLAVRTGARAYLKRQYTVVVLFFAVMVVILAFMAAFGYLTPFVPFAFLSGGFFSGLAGFIGMTVATSSNARTCNAAKQSLNGGLRVAFSSGAVMGLVVVGLGLLDLSFWYYFLNWFYRDLGEADKIRNITSAMITFGMGASSQALFARVGGGIFTKAADVGADLVGKVEAGIPEDDPRNPAVIADNVGDNVGDVAGMGADLYESYVGSIVATMALGSAAFYGTGLSLESVAVPMIMAAIGVVSSIIGTFFVRSGEQAEQRVLLKALRTGVYSSSLLIAIISPFLVIYTLGKEHIGVYFAVLSGLVAGNIIGFSTEYFTSGDYRPTRYVADQAQTGPATVIIGGLSVGMLSTSVPVIVVGLAILGAFYFAGGATNPALGLYGVGISAVGMLSTLGITLATDAYGPVADNAGGIAEMSHQAPEVRRRTDALDALGNTTAATGKGFAIGSAALTALALISAYKEEVILALSKARGILGTYSSYQLEEMLKNVGVTFNLSLTNPRVIFGLFVGGMMPFVFCSMTMRAVGRAAGSIVKEVRRQFKEIVGLMDGNADPDYASCVRISTAAAQKEMVVPSLMAIVAPIAVGLLFGVEAVTALLAGALVSGFVLAVMMANSGGSWDNAKKYIEAGHYGGKGSDPHKAGVVGDTVGDPFKDTSGPSLNILIKLMSMVALVFAAFTVSNALIK